MARTPLTVPPMARALWAACIVGLASWMVAGLSFSCGACDRTTEPGEEVYYRGGVTFGDGEVRQYDSLGAVDEYLVFPPGRTYRLVHGLGTTPRDVNILLSFDRRGNTFSDAAGNQAIQGPNTDEYIQVRNDTCADFFLRVQATVVLGDPIPVSADDAGVP